MTLRSAQPWQKDGVENADGRLRRYLPIDSIIGERLNIMSRRLGY